MMYNHTEIKTERAKDSFFGSSAIFQRKTRRFPSPPHGGFGFIGESHLFNN